MLKNKRTYSDWNNNNNNGCNFDIETKKELQIMFIMTPSLYMLSICNFALTVAYIFK
jgi:hypothetical protein